MVDSIISKLYGFFNTFEILTFNLALSIFDPVTKTILENLSKSFILSVHSIPVIPGILLSINNKSGVLWICTIPKLQFHLMR